MLTSQCKSRLRGRVFRSTPNKDEFPGSEIPFSFLRRKKMTIMMTLMMMLKLLQEVVN